MSKRTLPGVLIMAAAIAFGLWLGLSQQGSALQPGQPPFRNPVEQREQMIRELQEIKELIKQQNDLLRRSQKG